MAAPQELYAANSDCPASSTSAWPRFCAKPVLFCAIRNFPADFFAKRRLVCSSETTYVSRQSDAEGRAWIQKRDTDSLQGSAAREGTVGLH